MLRAARNFDAPLIAEIGGSFLDTSLHPAIATGRYLLRLSDEQAVENARRMFENPAGFDGFVAYVDEDPDTGERLKIGQINIFSGETQEQAAGSDHDHDHSRAYDLLTVVSPGARYRVDRTRIIPLGSRKVRGMRTEERIAIANNVEQPSDPASRALYHPTPLGLVQALHLSSTELLESGVQRLESTELHNIAFLPHRTDDIAVTGQLKGEIEDPYLSTREGLHVVRGLPADLAEIAESGRTDAATKLSPGNQLAAATIVLAIGKAEDIVAAMQASDPKPTGQAKAERLLERAIRTVHDEYRRVA